MSSPALTDQDLAALPIFPLPGAALFPGALLSLHVFEPRYRELTRDVLSGRKLLAVASLKPGFESDYQGRPAVFQVCGCGHIVDHVRYADGRYDISLRGLSRVRILHELPPTRSYRIVQAELIQSLPADPALSAALQAKVASLWRVLAPHLPEAVRNLRELTRDAEDVSAFSDRLAAALAKDADIAQSLLSEPDPCERLQVLTARLQTLCDSLRPSRGRSDTNLN
jgi:hypothetical protein